MGTVRFENIDASSASRVRFEPTSLVFAWGGAEYEPELVPRLGLGIVEPAVSLPWFGGGNPGCPGVRRPCAFKPMPKLLRTAPPGPSLVR